MSVNETKVPFCGYTVEDGYTAEECKTMNAEKGKEVAVTILAQMGGAAALAIMLGAKRFISHSDEGLGGVTFKFKGSRKVNFLTVILAPSDTYTLRFGRVDKNGYKLVELVEDVYCDQLTDVFRRVTGLETRVPVVRFARG